MQDTVKQVGFGILSVESHVLNACEQTCNEITIVWCLSSQKDSWLQLATAVKGQLASTVKWL